MRRFLLSGVIAVILAFGVWEAWWTDRWALSKEPERAANKLKDISRTVGDWINDDDETLDPRQVARAEMTGYLSRKYTNKNKNTPAALQVLIVAGRPGPTALHSPDVCYPAIGYQRLAPPIKYSVKSPLGEPLADCWIADYQRDGINPEPLRIRWSWTATGTWAAADNPRLEFAGYGFLYKLYVLRVLPRPNVPMTDDPTEDFLRVFLPELRQKLFPEDSASRRLS
jgi:Protein of unknown function (DUF3485)